MSILHTNSSRGLLSNRALVYAQTQLCPLQPAQYSVETGEQILFISRHLILLLLAQLANQIIFDSKSIIFFQFNVAVLQKKYLQFY